MRLGSKIVGGVAIVIGVVWIALTMLSAYSTLAQYAPWVARYFSNPTGPWILLFLCFCFLLHETRQPAKAPSDGFPYKEVIRLRNENEKQQEAISRMAKALEHTKEWQDNLEGRLAEAREILATIHLPRRLTDEQIQTISNAVRNGLDRHTASLIAAGWTQADARGLMFVDLVTVGNESETTKYRDDFARALREGGLSVAPTEIVAASWPKGSAQPPAGTTVAVYQDDPRNVVRPFIVEALRSAGVTVNEIDAWPMSAAHYPHEAEPPVSFGSRAAAVLFIGPPE